MECSLEWYKILSNAGYFSYYQPIVKRISTSDRVEIIGYESLVRRIVRNRVVSAAEIINSLKEESRSMRELDGFMTRLNSDIAGILPDDQFISVNVSAHTLVSPAFIQQLRRLDMRAPKMVFEITESEKLAMSEFAKLSNNVNIIRDLGYKIAIDDFGDGHSCLMYLNLIKADIVKISRDMLCVLKATEQTSRIQFMRDVITSLQRQEIKVILEGVEEPEDLGIASQLNIDHFQGYLFGKPGIDNVPGRIASNFTPHRSSVIEAQK